MRIASSAIAAAWIDGLRRFADESGASLIEYALVLGMISAIGVAGLTLLGNHASQTLSTAASSLAS